MDLESEINLYKTIFLIFCFSYHNVVEFKFTLSRQLDLLETKRNHVLDGILKLNKPPDDKCIQLLSDCCLLKEMHIIKKTYAHRPPSCIVF